VQLDPESPLTHAKLAEALWLRYSITNDQQAKTEALASLKNAQQRNPDVTEVLLLSGTIQRVLENYPEAQADVERAIELDRNNGDAWRQLGRVYKENNQPARALTAYRKAIEVQANYYKNYQDLGAFYFDRGEYENALEQDKIMMQLAPDLAASHYAVAAAELYLAKYDSAEYEFNVALQKEPNANAYLGLGFSRLDQGRELEAVAYFRSALKIGRPTPLAYLNLGSALRRSGATGESRIAYQQSLDLAETELGEFPNNTLERAGLAYACARLGNSGRARTEIQQALTMSKRANEIRWWAVQVYEALQERDRILDLIRDAPDSLLYRIKRFPDLSQLQDYPAFKDLLMSHHIQ